MTLREAGCETVAMTSCFERSESYAAFRAFGRVALRVPVLPRTRVVLINGRHRVESVVVENLATGKRRTIECDTVVTTGDWIPDHEIARLGGIDIDTGTNGPVVDTALRTSAPGVFAVGNLVHPVDTADAAALDGRHVAEAVTRCIEQPIPERLGGVRIIAAAPFRWVSPQRIAPGSTAPRDNLLLWTDEYQRFPTVRAVQDGRVLAQKRLPWPAAPGRMFRAPAGLIAGADHSGGAVTIELIVDS
jgi:hypothetical protein